MTRHARDLETAWAAGLFEGEGCLTIARRDDRYNPVCSFKMEMVDKDVVERFVRWADRGNISFHQRDEHQDTWAWNCADKKEVVDMITILYPYMGTRRRAKMLEALHVIANLKVWEGPWASRIIEAKDIADQALEQLNGQAA